MEPSRCRTSSSTVIPPLLMFTVMYGTVCWIGNRRRPPWRWPLGTLCRVETRTVKRRRSAGNLLSNCPRLVGQISALWLPPVLIYGSEVTATALLKWQIMYIAALSHSHGSKRGLKQLLSHVFAKNVLTCHQGRGCCFICVLFYQSEMEYVEILHL